MNEIIYKDESFRIIGACFEVYNHKGFGFTEPVYKECLLYAAGITVYRSVVDTDGLQKYPACPVFRS